MENNEAYFALNSFSSVVKEFNDFLDAYYPIRSMSCPQVPISDSKVPADRKCKFCNKPYGEVSFGNVAHIIPEFLGNRHLVSDFECDSCNSKFGEYDTAFAAWLGAIRTILKTRGKKEKSLEISTFHRNVW